MRDGTNTRKKLERCALALFVKKGVTATTIKDIAHKAGIAEGTLYRHYQSKDELAQNLFMHSYEDIASQIKQISLQQPTLNLKIEAMVHFFCEQYDKDPVLFNYLLLAQHTQLKIINESKMNAHELVVGIFNDAIRKKEVKRRDPHIYAALVMGIMLQAAVCRVYGRIARKMSEDADDLVKAIVHVIQY